MPWRPLPRIAFAICVVPFQPSSPADLPLEIGDELYIIEQGGHDGAWYRGYLVAPPSLLAGLTSVKGQTLEARVFSGIFPRCCVEVREVLGEGKNAPPAPDGSDTLVDARRAGPGEIAPNGIVTPTESASAASLSRKGSASHARRSSRSDHVPVLPSSAQRPLSRHRSKRTASHGSQWASRSEHMNQLAIPLSPVSPGPRDPSAPRPPAPVPMLKIGDETPTSAGEPLVDEIASCLREWHATKLHELLLAGRYSKLDKMSNLVQRLDTARRQLLHRVLTGKEQERLREQTVWDLVTGNKMLCGDVIVRSPSQRGRILTGDDSAVEITKLQSMMSLLDSRPEPPVDEHTLHHLFVNLKHVVGDVTVGSSLISMHLCRKEPGGAPEPLSEVYSFELTAKDGSANPLTGERMRSLFVDLSSNDIGEGASSGSSLYLVFKLLSNEPIRAIATSAGHGHVPRESLSSNSTGFQASQIGSLKGGRRSVMFSSKRTHTSGGHSSTSSDARTSMDTSRAQPSDSGRPGSSSTRNRGSSRDQKSIKRMVAVGALRVDELIRARAEADQNITLWTIPTGLEEIPADEPGWDPILTELYPSADGRYRKHPTINRISIHLKAFADPDAERLIEKTPTLLHSIKQTKKIGFSGAPTRSRSDIYLTLLEPFLPKNASLAHPKTGTSAIAATSSMANLQLTIEVRKQNGDRIENCIFPSSNSQGHTAWRTTAAERGEKWNLTVRLAVKPEDVPGSHIVMSIADAPGFPFALCWMPLWNQDAFIRDGEHSLTLYRYDEYTSSMIAGKGAYLGLPWSCKKKDEQVMGTMATLRLRTYLCSTKYSQDPSLLGLLKWRDQPPGGIIGLLKKFSFVPEIEIVKLLNEVFDALFEILVEYAGSDEYEDLIFNALVTVLGIVHDRRFNLGPLVDHYAETKFNYPFATSCLVRSYARLLINPTDLECSRKLRATFKVGRQVLKFIMNARQQQKQKEAGIGITTRQPTFTRELSAIFQALNALMANPSPVLIGTKTILAQNFHSWLPELHPSIASMDVLKLASDFIDSCAAAQGKLILYKLLLIRHLSDLQCMKKPDTRRVLITNTVKWLAPHWGQGSAITDQWKDQVRLCCSIVASQVEELTQEAREYVPKLITSYRYLQAVPRTKKKTLSLLFPTSYPFPTRPTTTEAVFDEAMIEISAVLAAMASLPISLDLDRSVAEVSEFLFAALQVYISILDCEAFPSSWLSVHIYQHKATLRTLEKVAAVLIDSCLPDPDEADDFNTELWRTFFDALLKLVSSEALALETFPEQKRRAVWKIAGDVREQGADLLQRAWEAIGWETSLEDKKQYGLEKMGGFQVQYVPSLVAPIVELCLSVHEGLRSVAIETLQTMIVSEWTLSGDLDLIQHEMIDCLDNLFKTRHLTEVVQQKHFIHELHDLFEPLAEESDDSLFTAVKGLITTIDELLDLLVAVHSAEAAGEVFHIMDTLHLMEFLKDMQKEDIYIRYVHQLVNLQAEARNHTEAGLALRLHAELYDWDPVTVVGPLSDPDYPAQTAFERKEKIYFDMIEFYEKGQSWDNALGTYLELVAQYEHNVFDFVKLGRAHGSMASIYDKLAKDERAHPRYFRVHYRGLGWPVGLRDKQFIFEASPNDRLGTFTDHMQQQHPSAQMLMAGVEEELEGQYLQIFPVSPQKDLTHPIYQRAKVASSIRDYFLLSRPLRFTSTSRRALGNNNQGLVERTVYATAEAFPTILRRSEIVSVETVTLSPLQAAIDRTTRKTGELVALEKKVQAGDDAALNPLISDLMLAVDTNQELCIAHYHSLLPDDTQDSSLEDEDETPPREPNLLENALKVALIDYALAIRRCLGLFSRPAHQATRADIVHRFEAVYQRELAALVPVNPSPILRTGDGLWLGTSTTSPPRVTSPPADAVGLASPRSSLSQSQRPARQDKRRLSLAFFSKNPNASTSSHNRMQSSSIQSYHNHRHHESEANHVNASTFSFGKENVRHPNRSSLSFSASSPPATHMTSPTTGTPTLEESIMSHFPSPESNTTATAHPSMSSSTLQDNSERSRPETSKSGRSGQSHVSTIHGTTTTITSGAERKPSVRKRFSMMGIGNIGAMGLGKKSSKSSVREIVEVREE